MSTREIIFDTETTGLDPEKGDRIVEIGAIEVIDLKPTGKIFHKYINPERHIPEDVVKIHGIDDARVANELTFAQIAQELHDFIGTDSKLVAHNASFDMKFINYQFNMVKFPIISMDRVTDTLAIARKKFPGQRVTLDALCSKYGVDNSGRDFHGALLDSELLFEVYFELRGGAQHGLVLADNSQGKSTKTLINNLESLKGFYKEPRSFSILETEKQAHENFIRNEIKDSLWLKSSEASQPDIDDA